MATGLLMLLDDIASVLDDVATLTKVAVKKTAGVLGDDLALNAQQVLGVEPNREIPIVLAVAKGSLINKAILVPAAIILSALLPMLVIPLLVVGGAFLCYEGVEKILHSIFHPHEREHDKNEYEGDEIEVIDAKAREKEKIGGAIRTDFILSAEIIVITLGEVAKSTIWVRIVVLVAIGILMTVGVYGLVAGIVKLDDLGAWLIKRSDGKGWKGRIGRGLLTSMPYFMKFLSIAGTVAMFLVGGGILIHNVEPLHHAVEGWAHTLATAINLGKWFAKLLAMGIEAIVGFLIGLIVVVIVAGISAIGRQSRPATG